MNYYYKNEAEDNNLSKTYEGGRNTVGQVGGPWVKMGHSVGTMGEEAGAKIGGEKGRSVSKSFFDPAGQGFKEAGQGNYRRAAESFMGVGFITNLVKPSKQNNMVNKYSLAIGPGNPNAGYTYGELSKDYRISNKQGQII